jgi:hypothetical protein
VADASTSNSNIASTAGIAAGVAAGVVVAILIVIVVVYLGRRRVVLPPAAPKSSAVTVAFSNPLYSDALAAGGGGAGTAGRAVGPGVVAIDADTGLYSTINSAPDKPRGVVANPQYADLPVTGMAGQAGLSNPLYDHPHDESYTDSGYLDVVGPHHNSDA